jgi:Tol biopolymer transport system component
VGAVTRLGSFEILGPLGAGGMGEVFRARDTRLNREVALKRLPSAVAADPDRLARFTREAQLLAALNHPNIAHIHGLEEAPGEPGHPPARALVLELVEGPTLAERIAAGRLPLDEALAIARQVAEAVDYAHEQGIIHRDLKPANIKLRPDGVVKVLDFGLAKALGVPGTGSSANHDLTNSPTFTDSHTAAGVILGTAAYMAPEQARGRLVDRRVDVWALGVVLFEMLTGRRPFAGETISDTIAAILKDDPDWSTLPPATPAGLRRLLARMLEKDPRKRLRDVGDLRFLLDDVTASGVGMAAGATAVAQVKAWPLWLRALPWLALLTALGMAPAAIFLLREAPPAAPVLRFSIPLEGDVERRALPLLSPDGRRLVYSHAGELWVRALDELDGRPLRGTAGAQYPFWSPDGDEIGYVTPTAFMRVGLDGSAPVRIADYRSSKGGRTPGGVWRRDGSIVFASSSSGSTLVTVPASGGAVTPLFERDPALEMDFHKPSLLPDGHRVLVVVDRPDRGADTIAVVDGTTRKVVLQFPNEFIDSPVYVPSGHLLFHRETTQPGLWAVPFSLDRLETTGEPYLVTSEGTYPSAASNGLLAYVRTALSGLEELVWFDIASGAVTPVSMQPMHELTSPRLSPDGTRVAFVGQVGQSREVIVVDLERRTHVSLGTADRSPSQVVWRDNRTVVWGSDSQMGSGRLTMRRADASQPAVPLFEGLTPSLAAGHLIFSRREPELGGGLFHAPWPSASERPGEATALHQTAEHEWQPALSPDGTLLAYAAGDPGGTQIILRRYPKSDDQWRLSPDSGTLPLWSPDGSRIYFRDSSGQILGVDVTRTPQLSLSAPRVVAGAEGLTRGPEGLISVVGFDISRDGRRLLMMRPAVVGERRPPAIVVVQGWHR